MIREEWVPPLPWPSIRRSALAPGPRRVGLFLLALDALAGRLWSLARVGGPGLAFLRWITELDFARSGGPAGDEQKALEEAGGDFRALRVGP